MASQNLGIETKMLPQPNDFVVGLRERKKAKTRAAIQQEALRLFRRQGYAATTVEQIAAAAEVSPSTFFRYFPTKEDVVLFDILDPLFIASFRTQPLELNPLQALRAALGEVRRALTTEEMAQQHERALLFFSVPELRSAWVAQISDGAKMLAELIGDRLGCSPDDFAVCNFSGAIVGVAVAAMLRIADDRSANLLELVDRSFAHLEAGLPLEGSLGS